VAHDPEIVARAQPRSASGRTVTAMTRGATHRAERLELLTIAWNVVEVFVTVGLGIAAGSLALVAFGLDSLVEIFASGVVLWQLRGDGGSRTRHAMLLVALAFFALTVVLSVGALYTIASGHRADDSVWGVAYLAVTAVVMFTLAWSKWRLGAQIGNHPLEHEARITFLDGCLATGVLVALAVEIAFGWWWADPLAALVVAVACVPEGLDAWRDWREGVPEGGVREGGPRRR
jgi:divalent metal cation (Fe/Co/Zn/Cd) transporter